MSRGPDATAELERALLESADAAGCPLTIRVSDVTGWASATFATSPHRAPGWASSVLAPCQRTAFNVLESITIPPST